MKKNLHSIDVRFHHRICDAQKHLVQGIGHMMKEYINKVTSIQNDLRVIQRFQMSFKINLIDVRIQKRTLDKLEHAFYRCENSSRNL